MARFLFRVKARGGFTKDMKQIKIPHEKGLENVIINCGTEGKARKLARKGYDGTYWLLGVVDENDKIIKIADWRRQQELNKPSLSVVVEGKKLHQRKSSDQL